MHEYFLTTYKLTKRKIHWKSCILQKRDLYLNQFSNKKGAIAKLERPKKHPIWAAHPRTHLSIKYPPPPPPVWLQPQNLYTLLRVILAEKGTHS